MVPRSLKRQLNRVRRRERLLRLTWTAARCLAAFAVVLAAACLIDFVVDLYRDTPRWLRLGLFGVQIALWSVGAFLVLRLLARRLSDTEVALWIEEKIPELGHRLISAVQLNRPGAATAGMSPAMIAAVTRQAEEQAAVTHFTRVADARRLKWAAQLLAPFALVGVLVFLLWPDTLQALLARQFLDDRPIPRSLAIESAGTHQVWPAGEEGVLRFRVRGAFAEHLKGEVRIDLQDGESERHELIFDSQDEDGAATFLARVPPLSRDFSYRAWLKDGRTHRAAEVHFEPRPIVQRQQAWVQLPASIGLKSSGKPYEEPQKAADIVYRLPGSTARVAIETQKPIVRATIEVLGPAHAFAESVKRSGREETVRRSVELVVGEGGCQAEGVFPFKPMQTETAYRIVVRDEFGLENNDKPRRGIRTAAVDPPEVALLPETLSARDGQTTEDDEIEGIPILLGQRVPLAYECKAVYGLSHARLRYRVIAHTASRDEDGEPRDTDFLPLPLGVPHGQMNKIGMKSRREFFTSPAEDADHLDGTEGGGNYDFDSSGIPDGKGGLLKLQEGDRIQFYVEVFGRADPEGTPGRSVLREKEIVNQKDFWAWVEKKEDHKERIRQLEERQRGVSATTSLLPDERPRFPPDRTPIPLPPDGLADNTPAFGRSWQLLGPFPSDKDDGHARVFPPERDMTDLAREYDGIAGKVRWRGHRSTTDKIDLQSFFSHGEAGVAYAVCWVKPAWQTRAILSAGSDDGIKIWLNRKLVLDRAVHREAVPGDDKTPITLDNTWQEILVKVDNRFGSWAFYLDLLDPATGKPFVAQRLSVRTTPDSKENRFVKKWLVIGPFHDAQNRGHSHPYQPELGPVDLKREFEGRRGKVRWKEYRGNQDRINLLSACNVPSAESRGVVGYAVMWVRADRKRSAVLASGNDDAIKIWLNRKLVHDKVANREAVAASERTPIELIDGWNEVLVKVTCNNQGHWSFFLELREPRTDEPLQGVEYRMTPPEKKR